MGLQELKKAEDLKKQLREIEQQVTDAREAMQKQKVDEMFSDFKRYFSENDFTIEDGANNPHAGLCVNATYGDLSGVLTTHPLGDEYIGSQLRINLDLALPHKKQYYVLLRVEAHGVNRRPISDPTPEQVEELIESKKFSLEHVEEERWFLTLKKESNSRQKLPNTVDQDDKQFVDKDYDNMYELLTIIIK